MIGFIGSTKFCSNVSRNIKFLKPMHGIVTTNSSLYQEMNFPMTTHAQHIKIINRTIVRICIDVMNVKTFSFRGNKTADFTALRKNPFSMHVTPALISRTITMVRRAFNSILACSRTVFRLIGSVRPRLINFSAMRANFIQFRFFYRNAKAFLRAKLSDLFLTCDRAVAGLTSHVTSITAQVN